MRKISTLVVLSLLSASLSIVSAQVEKKEGFSPAIEDNSFLIEEAYNQEEGVVQHISNLMCTNRPSSTYYYSFTQEWPLFGQTNQLSYTIPLTFFRKGPYGLGDIMINYRYQILGHDSWAAASPRISVILPTGSTEKDLGTGGYGLQMNLPFSKRLSESFVAHFNLGATALYPKYTDMNQQEKRKLLPSYFWGGSLIWLKSSNLNFMLEFLNTINGGFDENGNVRYENVYIINPGLRYAINLNSLQIVPGLSLPVNIQNGQADYPDSFFYLSFEHPF